MKTFKIEVQEFLAKIIEVRAKNIEEAFSIINDQYNKAKIVLDYSDFVEVNFIDINSMSKSDEIKILISEVIEYLNNDELKNIENSEKYKYHISSKLERLKAIIE